MAVVQGFVRTAAFLERSILGLHYEVRGAKYLPKDNKYIIAAKHQSAYETLKLHILFKDPAIVLKRELLKIPLWGKYLAKSDVIAIDRTTPKTAIASIKEGAVRVAAQNRPIIIFPQGTRVSPQTIAAEKPYKVGIVRIQEATGLPIIPMALNSGIYQPRNAWIKKPGTVIFEFLPPIAYEPGTIPDITLKKIEMGVEEASSRLREEAIQSLSTRKKRIPLFAPVTIILICFGYTLNWFTAKYFTEKAILQTIQEIKNDPTFTKIDIAPPTLNGFPGRLNLLIPSVQFETLDASGSINIIRANSWPLLGMPINIQTDEITIKQNHWRDSLKFQSLKVTLSSSAETLTIYSSELNHENTRAELTGTLQSPEEKTYPLIDMEINIYNHEPFIALLVQQNIIKKNPAMIATFALQALKRDGAARTTITSDNNKLYLGPIKIYEFPIEQAIILENGRKSQFATKRIKPAPAQ